MREEMEDKFQQILSKIDGCNFKILDYFMDDIALSNLNNPYVFPICRHNHV
jgi:hypothetical protein